MAFREGGCLIFLGCSIVIILFIPMFMWLSVLTSNETLVKPSVEDFFVPAMINNAAASLTTTSAIFFDIQLKDEAYEMGVYYDNLTLSFYYVGIHPSIMPIAIYTIPGFYQKGGEHGSTTQYSYYVETHGIPWDEVSKNGTMSSEVVFRVDLATSVRFKYGAFKSKRHELLAGADVKVNINSGRKVEQKGIELKSYAQHHSGGLYRGFTIFSLCFWILLSIIWAFSICFTCKPDY